MSSPGRIAVVTGANKGIGLAIVRNLALKYGESSPSSTPLLIYLTARSPERGAEAVKTLSADPQLQSSKTLQSSGGNVTITYHALDISSTTSIHSFRDFLHSTHPDGIDILINNAGIALSGFDSSVVRDTLQTNYHGTLRVCESLIPLLCPDGLRRVVNVSSTIGLLDRYSPALRDAFHHAASTPDIENTTKIMNQFQAAVDKKAEQEAGFPSSAYGVSKAGLTSATKSLAKKYSNVTINACCPGFVNTDMTKGHGHLTPDQGARTPVMLALGDVKGTTGEFWKNEKVVEW